MRNTFFWVKKEYPRQIIACYFFDARSPFLLAKSALGLYRALLHQLLTSCTDIKDLFLNKFTDKLITGEVEPWTEKEIQNFLIEINDSGHPPNLTIFIDALDESQDEDLQDMVAYLEGLQQRATDAGVRLRICLSSRHYPHISISGNSIVIEEQSGHEGDIERYVRTRLLGGETAEMQEVRYSLLRKATGVFLWVALLVPSLNRLFYRGDGLAAMIEELERASPKIQDLFYNTLMSDPDDIEECITLLRWVLYAKRPLSPEELYRAIKKPWSVTHTCGDMISISSDKVSRYLLTCSRGLVEFTNSSPPSIQFVHETVRETLLNVDLPQKVGGFRMGSHLLDFRPDACNATITEICLHCLLSFATGDAMLLLRKRRELDNMEAFAAYSARFWWQHILETTGDLRKHLLKLSSSLLTNHGTLFVWTKLYDIDRKVEGLVSSYTNGLHPYYAASANIWELIQEYIDAGTDVNIKGGRMDTPLGAAAYWGHIESVRVLLEAGANIDEKIIQSDSSTTAFSPLIAAVRQDHSEVVITLLEHGAQIDRIPTHRTALCEAVSTGEESMVRLLLQRGANVNAVHAYNSWHVPVHLAIEDGRTSIARLLLEYGADISSEELGRYLGHYIYSSRNWDMIELLLRWNADINPYNFEYYHALFTRNNRLDLVTLLHGAYTRDG